MSTYGVHCCCIFAHIFAFLHVWFLPWCLRRDLPFQSWFFCLNRQQVVIKKKNLYRRLLGWYILAQFSLKNYSFSKYFMRYVLFFQDSFKLIDAGIFGRYFDSGIFNEHDFFFILNFSESWLIKGLYSDANTLKTSC